MRRNSLSTWRPHRRPHSATTAIGAPGVSPPAPAPHRRRHRGRLQPPTWSPDHLHDVDQGVRRQRRRRHLALPNRLVRPPRVHRRRGAGPPGRTTPSPRSWHRARGRDDRRRDPADAVHHLLAGPAGDRVGGDRAPDASPSPWPAAKRAAALGLRRRRGVQPLLRRYRLLQRGHPRGSPRAPGGGVPAALGPGSLIAIALGLVAAGLAVRPTRLPALLVGIALIVSGAALAIVFRPVFPIALVDIALGALVLRSWRK